MVNAELPNLQLKIRARPIEEADTPGVVNLLTRGFGVARKREFWVRALTRLGARNSPPGLPRYGYLMEANGAIVGALLQIYSASRVGTAPTIRCNVSSWYVDPEFRGYAALLVSHALKRNNVTYMNVSPAPHTRTIALAQGYTRYSDGIFLTLPALSGSYPGNSARVVDAKVVPDVAFDPHERELLLEHADYGCISFWCITSERAHAFVFHPRVLKRVVPCSQLIYCSEMDQFVRFARPIGRHLLRCGRPLVIVDSNGPIHGLRGKYFDNTMPKYFKGPQPPKFGDLAYTEIVLFGI